MKLLAILFLIVGAVISASATAQAPDKLIFEGKERHLLATPLEDYYQFDLEKRPNFMIEPFTTSSGNWRGYVATWSISARLYLTKIDSWLCLSVTKASCSKAKLSNLFPDKYRSGRVSAEWFTGELRVADGKLLQYVHLGYASPYERELIFRVTNGVVADPILIDNTKKILPTEMEAAQKELEKLQNANDRPESSPPKLTPRSGLAIIPGQGVFSIGTKRSDLEQALGEGDPDSSFDDVYFIEYPKAGVQVSYRKDTNTVHVIFLYSGQARYEDYAVPVVKTDRGIDWRSTEKDVLKAYGKPHKDYSDNSGSWRRLEYPGIDFLFTGGKLGRIGILGPDGN